MKYRIDIRRFYMALAALFAAILMIGCVEDEGLILPDVPPADVPPSSSEPEEPSKPEDPGDVMPLISTDPDTVTDSMKEDVIIILNTKGTKAAGFKGDLYAHTGVLTSLSKGDSDWKYVKADWGVNIDDCKLENKDDNIWHLVIKGGPRAYYGVPDGEAIKRLAFVFRSADSKLEVKNDGKDIFVDVEVNALAVAITAPSKGTVMHVGDECDIVVESTSATSVTLFKNEDAVAEGSEGVLKYRYAPAASEEVVFRAVATDGEKSVEHSIDMCVLVGTHEEASPVGDKDGVTVEGTSATFVLYAPGKKSVILLGDFNDYTPINEDVMKRDGDYFWTTISGLQSGEEYGYQYLVDGSIKVADPYATKILDPWNDKYISSSVYPNLKQYPAEYTSDIVSVFEVNPTEYQWSITDFERPAENMLAIYELLFRDFTSEGSVDAACAKLDYLKELGVNAVELMPIQEFDGNDSWGYNPCFYFAADKAYGTDEAYKRFIDECHKRGMAVILDVVFNHATGQFPWAKMWWDSSKSCTAEDNPFFNVEAPHNWSVFHDFKHLYPKTRAYFKDVLKYWLEEYNIDGFRFDLTKGFVQNPNNYDAGGYSAERVEILTDYARAIRDVEPDAYVIFEHFCGKVEEDELYKSVGAMCWNNNQRGGYIASVKGSSSNSNFSGFSSARINNIETHDEERIAYEVVKSGQSWVKSDWTVISKRLQAIYAFHFLSPYPKMMWQFGELGYDVSIEENGRTGKKPVRWEYFNDTNRKSIYTTISKVLKFRNERKDIYAQPSPISYTVNVSDSYMGSKMLIMDNVIYIANFSSTESTTLVNVPESGKWRNLMTDEEVTLGDTHEVTLEANDFVIFVR